MFETEPQTVELTTENGEQVEHEKIEAIYVGGDEKPRYTVGADDVWTSENYLCIRLDDSKGPDSEVHRIPHERIRMRKRVVKRATEEIEP